MVVDKYVGRCLDVGSTPTGSIIPLHSFAFLGKTLLNQRFLFCLWYSLVFFCEKRSHKGSHKGSHKRSHKQTLKQTLFLKKGYKKGYNFCRIPKIIVLFHGRHGIRTHARCYTPTAFPTRPLKPLE